jgi:S-DNA-T family DNA segregation ATPase FtsK/SpoIIIE
MRGDVIHKESGWEFITLGSRWGWHPPRGFIGWCHLLGVVLARLARLLWTLTRLFGGIVLGNPVPAAVAALLLLAAALGPSWATVAAAVVVAVVLGGWFWCWPGSFDTWVTSRARRWVRRRRYRRRWPDLMAAVKATVTDRRRRMLAPHIARVRSGRFADVLTVRLPDGITSDGFAETTPAIAEAMRARDARIIGHGPRRWLPDWLSARLPAEFAPGPRRPGVVRLRLAFGDPLVHTITAPVPLNAEAVDLTAVPIGQRDDGTPWLLRLLGTHVLLAGATGSGKGSVLWSLLAAVGPAIRQGTVRVVGIDPKGGMELGYGRELFHRLVTVDGPGGDTDVVAFLEELADEADHRAARLAGHVRTLRPSVDMPFVLVVIDELASLTSFIADNRLRQRGEAALGRLLTKGRAPGMCVVGAIQDPRKDVLKYRDLFPTRIALRLVEASAVDLVLGDGARRRGARCDHISETAPGVGYVIEDGTAAVARVRAAYLTDDDVRRLAITYRPGTTPAPVLVGLPGGIA